MKKRVLTLLTVVCLLCVLALPVAAHDEVFIYDDAYLLSDAAYVELEQQCVAAAEEYGCGIYVVTLEEFSSYGYDALGAAEAIYTYIGMGIGENKNGIMLLLSMSERDFALVAYGDIANSVFTDRAQDRVIDAFLDNFANDDWEGGLRDYVEICVYGLENFDGVIGEAYDGYYEGGVYYPAVYPDETLGERFVRVWNGLGYFGFIVSFVIAVVVCGIQVSNMKTARMAKNANNYFSLRGLDIHLREDRLTHTTHRTIIRKKEDNDYHGGGGGFSSGSTSVRSSGFSGTSGKF